MGSHNQEEMKKKVALKKQQDIKKQQDRDVTATNAYLISTFSSSQGSGQENYCDRTPSNHHDSSSHSSPAGESAVSTDCPTSFD